MNIDDDGGLLSQPQSTGNIIHNRDHKLLAVETEFSSGVNSSMLNRGDKSDCVK